MISEDDACPDCEPESSAHYVEKMDEIYENQWLDLVNRDVARLEQYNKMRKDNPDGAAALKKQWEGAGIRVRDMSEQELTAYKKKMQTPPRPGKTVSSLPKWGKGQQGDSEDSDDEPATPTPVTKHGPPTRAVSPPITRTQSAPDNPSVINDDDYLSKRMSEHMKVNPAQADRMFEDDLAKAMAMSQYTQMPTDYDEDKALEQALQWSQHTHSAHQRMHQQQYDDNRGAGVGSSAGAVKDAASKGKGRSDQGEPTDLMYGALQPADSWVKRKSGSPVRGRSESPLGESVLDRHGSERFPEEQLRKELTRDDAKVDPKTPEELRAARAQAFAERMAKTQDD